MLELLLMADGAEPRCSCTSGKPLQTDQEESQVELHSLGKSFLNSVELVAAPEMLVWTLQSDKRDKLLEPRSSCTRECIDSLDLNTSQSNSQIHRNNILDTRSRTCRIFASHSSHKGSSLLGQAFDHHSVCCLWASGW
mmetsp:Transcript_12248/g.28264  ORF Transcript_12248/g.28264 Transcript_12248/m.28264 type:complete len:138 (+) Transcript_12248:1033-1446(+)